MLDQPTFAKELFVLGNSIKVTVSLAADTIDDKRAPNLTSTAPLR